MERTAVRSTEIAVVGYDKASSILEVTFRRGGVYHYQNVSSEIYQKLLDAESMGTFFAQQIKDKYSYSKIA